MENVYCSRLEALLYVRTWNFYRDSTWNFGTTHGAVTHALVVVALVGASCRKPFYPIEDLVIGRSWCINFHRLWEASSL